LTIPSLWIFKSFYWTLFSASTVEVFVSSIKLLRLPTFGLLVLGMATDVSINSALSPFLVGKQLFF